MSVRTAARWALALAAILVAVAWRMPPREFRHEAVIRNSLIVDGTGNPGYIADIAVNRGRITEIGSSVGSGKIEIEGKGLVAAPGFIDVHTHAENVVELPRAENFLMMGVTTLVIGNCGSSAADIGRFLNDLDRRPTSVNVGTLIGHNTLRSRAIQGPQGRAPSAAELESMVTAVRRGMAAGALGLSTGLIYLPGTFAQTDEIVALASASSEYGGIYASHMRNESTRIEAAIDELLLVARKAHSRVELSHIKLGGPSMWGKADSILRKLDDARSAGIEVTQDQYVYTASSTLLTVLFPDKFVEGGTEAFKARMKDPKLRTEMEAEMKRTLGVRGNHDYSYVVLSSCALDPKLNGKSVAEASKILIGNDDLQSQFETVVRLQVGGGARCVFHGIDERDVRTFLKHPNTMVASDSACRTPTEPMPHPRGYGNNARVLGRYVREEKVLRIEDAIRKMSSLPAQTFRLKGRGLLAEGYAADIVLFDPSAVSDSATYTDPHRFATGFRHVFVNGAQVIRDGRHTGARKGQAIRGPGFRRKATK